MLVDGRPVPGGIFDFALFFFHCARPLLDRGSGALSACLTRRICYSPMVYSVQVRVGEQ